VGRELVPVVPPAARQFKSDAKVARKLMYEYEVVLVDVGRFDRNLELADSYKADLKKNGIPSSPSSGPAARSSPTRNQCAGGPG